MYNVRRQCLWFRAMTIKSDNISVVFWTIYLELKKEKQLQTLESQRYNYQLI